MKLSNKIIATLMITAVFSSNYYTYAAQLNSTNQFAKVDLNDAINCADQLHNQVVKINDDSSLEALCKSDEYEKSFQKLSCNNIIAVYHNEDNYNSIADKLGYQFNVTDDNEKNSANTYCTLYYYDQDNVPIIHDIDIDQNWSEKENNEFVNSVVSKVKREIVETNTNEFSVAKLMSTSYTTKYLGKYVRSYKNEDISLLEVSYKFYTLQNYQGNDFYTVIGTINANPGRAMYDGGDKSYDYDIQGDGLDVSISAENSGHTRVEYGPSRTVGESSYSYSLGGDWSSSGVSVSGGFSYSQSISDTDINVNSLPNITTWNVVLSGEAQKQTCTFSPAITYSTSKSAEYAKFYVDTKFNTDAWNEFPTYTNIGKSVVCYPSSIKK